MHRKDIYEWPVDEAIDHSMNAVRAVQYTADFFVTQARKNMRSMPASEMEVAI